MINLSVFLISLLFSFFANASDEVGNWYYSKFPSEQMTVPEGSNLEGWMYDFCRRKSNTDLTSYPKDDNETALGEYTAGCFSYESVNDTQWIFSYDSARGDHPGPFFLYAYKIQNCADDEEYSKTEHSCVLKKTSCPSSGTEFLGGRGTGSLIFGSDSKWYVIDGAPASVCKNKCVLNKPDRAVNCFSDDPNLTQGQSAHCNYNYQYSGQDCAEDQMYGMGEATGGYAMNASADCSPEEMDPFYGTCPKDNNDSTTVGSGGTQVGGGTPGGSGGSGGTGGDGGGDNGGTGGTGGSGGTGGDGGTGSGGGDGDGSGDQEPSCPGCTGGSLSEPSRKGSFADAIATLDSQIVEGKALIKNKMSEIKESVSKQIVFELDEGTGQLQCDSVHVQTLDIEFELCLSDYSEQLGSFKYFILFIATLVAFFIVFRD